MMRIGLYAPEWMLARHNTDHRMAVSFARLAEFAPCEMSFAAAPTYTWSFNFQRLLQRALRFQGSVIRHRLRSGSDFDALYCYGEPPSTADFFAVAGSRPVVVTTGFMSDRYMAEIGGGSVNRQREADALARNLERAARIHFHSEGGRQRFLRYRPEYAEKTLSIPFLLPCLTCADTNQMRPAKNERAVRILFVGAEGIRKGLLELVATLDELGGDYLRSRRVEVTIVSRDRPQPQSSYEIEWHRKLPHPEILSRMREADIFVLVPRRESYGLVFVEAMAAGCAVISDDEETRREILGDAAVAVRPGDNAALAAELRKLIEDSASRMELSRKGLDRARGLFLPEVVGVSYGDCFRKVISES